MEFSVIHSEKEINESHYLKTGKYKWYFRTRTTGGFMFVCKCGGTVGSLNRFISKEVLMGMLNNGEIWEDKPYRVKLLEPTTNKIKK